MITFLWTCKLVQLLHNSTFNTVCSSDIIIIVNTIRTEYILYSKQCNKALHLGLIIALHLGLRQEHMTGE